MEGGGPELPQAAVVRSVAVLFGPIEIDSVAFAFHWLGWQCSRRGLDQVEQISKLLTKSEGSASAHGRGTELDLKDLGINCRIHSLDIGFIGVFSITTSEAVSK